MPDFREFARRSFLHLMIGTVAVAGLGHAAVAETTGLTAQIAGKPETRRPLKIKEASAGFDQNGLPAVNIELTPESARVFGDLTKGNLGKRLEIRRGDKVLISPVVMTVNYSGSLVLTGSYTVAQTQKLAKELNASAK